MTRPGNLTAAETAALAAITAACPRLAQLRGHQSNPLILKGSGQAALPITTCR
jgi:hypothetical protein